MAPSPAIMGQFKQRKDNQIMGLELLAISLGMCTFEWLLVDRKVVVHCDNKGSEVRLGYVSKGVLVFSCFARHRFGEGLLKFGITPNWFMSNGYTP